MTTPILFLLGAVALSALGGLVVWIASRPRPERFGSTIETFTRDLDALAPPGHARAEARTPQGARAPQRPRSAPQPAQRTAPRPAQQSGTRPRPGPRPNNTSGQR